MTDEKPERNGSTNGPTEPNQRPPERREEPAEEAMKGPAVISEANARQRARDGRRPQRDR
ncbi:hypothetical protein [Bosea sp. (in: a-proteobacteria)]|uniref:hypothetical protein n=1 Tax=Bosea sp. (in: a-proteobacteria) TaxID=1871050 RepID=UPI002612B533|nr:hypothetical protein [Bosea sp. (in: a-proteobacteria)]MCO5091250.1 hypothetical protein [Bosea sp. (in: a-proteobacteria)]